MPFFLSMSWQSKECREILLNEFLQLCHDIKKSIVEIKISQSISNCVATVFISGLRSV